MGYLIVACLLFILRKAEKQYHGLHEQWHSLHMIPIHPWLKVVSIPWRATFFMLYYYTAYDGALHWLVE